MNDVQRSTGLRAEALLQILAVTSKLAAPFDPFPTIMRERYPVLRFAYEWQFMNGRLGDSSVYSDGR